MSSHAENPREGLKARYASQFPHVREFTANSHFFTSCEFVDFLHMKFTECEIHTHEFTHFTQCEITKSVLISDPVSQLVNFTQVNSIRITECDFSRVGDFHTFLTGDNDKCLNQRISNNMKACMKVGYCDVHSHKIGYC